MVEITAHRGASGLAPENTWAAIDKAVELGCDGIEIDVQVTSDGKVVLFHDNTTKRIACSRKVITKSSYEQLKDLDIGGWFAESFSEERVPLLTEVVNKIPPHIKINIELKVHNGGNGIAEKVANLISDYKMHNRCIVTSFDIKAIRRIKKLDSSIRAGMIVGFFFSREALKPEYEVISMHKRHATEKRIKQLRELGKEIHVWTVNKPKDMRKMMERKVDSIITNYPDQLQKISNKGAISKDE